MAVTKSEGHPLSIASQHPSSSHRLPTVSATQALLDLQAKGSREVSSGLRALDAILQDQTPDTAFSDFKEAVHGIPRNTITEIWGPVGSGKTTFALQVASNALKDGSEVVWIDAGPQLSSLRLSDIVRTRSEGFHYVSAPRLAHLLALILHPPTWFPPNKAGVLVIDGLHTVFDIAYPRGFSSNSSSRTEQAKWAAARRYAVLGSLSTALKKLAALRDLSVIITTGCVTRVRSGNGRSSGLAPGISGAEWETSVTNRLALFRDYPPAAMGELAQRQTYSARYVGVQKLKGRALAEEGDVEHIIPFEIDTDGLKDIAKPPTASQEAARASFPRPVLSPMKSRKRTHEEIADSEDEISSEYGWLAEDEIAAEGLVDEDAVVADEADRENG